MGDVRLFANKCCGSVARTEVGLECVGIDPRPGLGCACSWEGLPCTPLPPAGRSLENPPPGPWLKVPSRSLGPFAGRGIQLPVCEHEEVCISCLATLILRREQGGSSVAARV